jgi:hypothetical protein
MYSSAADKPVLQHTVLKAGAIFWEHACHHAIAVAAQQMLPHPGLLERPTDGC